MSAWRDTWEQRPAGERRAIAWGAVLLAVVMVVALVWLPLERMRTRLAQEVPALRASVASLERDAQEAQRLRALPPVQRNAATPLAALAANSALQGANVTVLDPQRVRLTANDVGFASLLEWLRATQAGHGLRVESGRVEALPVKGRVRAELVLGRS